MNTNIKGKLAKKMLTVFSIFCIIFLSVGYASFNTELSISGDATVKAQDILRITKVEMSESIYEGYETYNRAFSYDTTSMFVTLPNSQSQVSYTVEIYNRTNNKYILSNIEENVYSNTNIKYKISHLEKYDVIASNQTIEFMVTFYRDDNITENMSNTLILKYDFLIYEEQEPNEPVLASNMIPVYFDGSVWRKADVSNIDINYGWYNYRKKLWANAVTVNENNRQQYLNSSVGTIIDIADINTMWVWIPRFNAVIPTNFNGGTRDNPGEITVNFVSNNATALNAFNFGTQNLNGFWLAKFENSATTIPDVVDNTERTVIIKPAQNGWRFSPLSTYFKSIKNMVSSSNIYGFDISVDAMVDTHLIKNNEWGAVAYLTQSKYGRCENGICIEVRNNNCQTFKTGVGASEQNNNASQVTCTAPINQYYGEKGMLASTTGNVYGAYDLNGGLNEYVMGNFGNRIALSGFEEMPESKYYSYYTVPEYVGDALKETQYWYNDYNQFANNYDAISWYSRGGYMADAKSSGLFYFMGSTGEGHRYRGSRSTLTIN